MRRFICILLIALYSAPATAWGQEVLRFLILASDSKRPVADVVCRAYDASHKLRAYRISNNKGEVQIPSDGISSVSFFKLNYKTSQIKIEANEGIKTVYLEGLHYTLREVTIKTDPIRQQGDTIRYNASQFVGQSDRYLEDLIAKMPGLSIDKEGYIRYQGQFIKRMYVEGKDLLGSQYNIAAKALPAEGIAEVQILENHQHIRRLDGKVPEEKASLNIRLKKSHRHRLIGDLTLGASKINPPRGLGEAKLSHFGKTYQGLYTPQANNLGIAYKEVEGSQIDINNIEVFTAPEQALSGEPYRELEDLKLNRYLDNRSLATTANGLLSLDSISLIKYNAVGLVDKREQTSSTRQVFGGLTPIVWERDKAYQFKKQNLSLATTYERNSLSTYLTNILSLKYQDSKNGSSISANNTSYQQHTEQKYYQIENTLSTSFSLFGRDIVYKGFVRYSSLPEALSVRDIGVYAQDFGQRRFTLNNSASSLWSLSKGTLSLGLLQRYQRSHFEVERKSSNSSQLSLKIRSSYTHRYAQGYWALGLSPQLERISLHGSSGASSTASKTLYALAPSLSWKHNLTSKLQLYLHLSQDQSLIAEAYPLLGELRTSYWDYQQSSGDIYQSTQGSATLNLTYKDIYRGLFARLHLGYKERDQDYVLGHTYEQNRYLRTYIKGKQQFEQWTIGAGIDKSWIDAGLTLKYNSNYSHSDYNLMQNSILSRNNLRQLGHSLQMIWKTQDFLLAKAEILHNISWIKNSLYQASQPSLSLIKARGEINLIPSKVWQWQIGWESYWNQHDRALWTKGLFLDISTSYKISRVLEVSLGCTNLFDRREYQIQYVQDLNSETFAMPLRGREFLIKATYHL